MRQKIRIARVLFVHDFASADAVPAVSGLDVAARPRGTGSAGDYNASASCLLARPRASAGTLRLDGGLRALAVELVQLIADRAGMFPPPAMPTRRDHRPCR